MTNWRRFRPRRYSRVALVVLLVDRAVKALVERSDRIYDISPITIGAVYNREGVLGLPVGNTLLLFLGAGICALIFWLLSRTYQSTMRAGLWLLLAGALGNTLDRFLYDGVLDVVAIGPSAHFNIADLSILAGAGLLVFALWQQNEASGRTKTAAPAQRKR